MKILYFPKNFSNIYIFCSPYFYATVRKFRLLDYVILLYAAVLAVTFKSQVINCSQ